MNLKCFYTALTFIYIYLTILLIGLLIGLLHFQIIKVDSRFT